MYVKSVEKETSKANVVVEITREDLEQSLNKVYLKYRKNIMIPGFRKGKAPRAIIEAAYGKHVFYEDAIEEMFPQVYQETVLKQDIKPVGRPGISAMDIAQDGSVTLTIATDLYPEVTLGQYKGLEVEKVEVVSNPAEVDAEIERMANNVARISTVERPAQNGDTAVIDFEGFLDGVAFEGGKGESHELKLGSGSFIPGFEEQVVGMSAGEEKDVNVTFPADYQAKELAGKAVVFKVKAHEIKETIVPEKDDEFVKDVSEFDTMAELRADIEKRIVDEKQAGIDRAFENAAVEKATANMTAEIPDSMVEEELERQLERMDYELRGQGASLEAYAQMMGGNMDAIRNSLRPSALSSVKTSVLLNAIVEAEDIAVSEEECEEEYAKLAENYKMELDKVKQLLQPDGMKGDLQVRKAAKLIADSAVAVAPKEETEAAE
ncbi:MAG: trigger factor [Oscillospiraceae bacterium]|jgi:trigger factor|nr:trigger factor [Oscillospiraceae bacterium]